MTTIPVQPEDEAKVGVFAEQLFKAGLATMELANIELGYRLGLYDVLADGRDRTPDELATDAGIAPRYAREWLEQQASAGVLEVDDPSAEPGERRFALPQAHAHVLLDDDSETCMKPLVGVVPWVGQVLPIMTREFREGGGVAFGDFALHDLQAAMTRPVFRHHLVQSWLPALPDVNARLVAGEPLRVAEVGCGEGLAAVILAQAYPAITVDGYDLDEASVEAARRYAKEAGLEDRVRFQLADAGELEDSMSYDLVLAIEMLHDVPDPVAVLTTMRRLAGPTGAVLVADERTEDTFTLPSNEMERLFYAFSTLHCLADSMHGGGIGTGTVIRADTVREYAEQAGFAAVEILDVEHPQFRLYRLT